MADETYTPDSLISGTEFPALTVPVTIAAGQNLVRGAVIGEITAEPGMFKLVDKTAVDGTQKAKHILAAAVDATLAASPGVGYDTGIFNPAALTLAVGTVVDDVETTLRDRSIFLRAMQTL